MKIYDDDLNLTMFGRVVGWLDSTFRLYHVLPWRWLMLKIHFESPYCARCGGCGYVECCGIKCDKGWCCAGYYSDRECVNTASPLMYVLDDLNEAAIYYAEHPDERPELDSDTE